ncbi:MAG: PAS domain S-box protein [Ktedonobacterales bacterium]|nr:PAS domain S-box protein [Ktedonobacterales bacterium]
MVQPPSRAPIAPVYDLVVIGASAGGIEALSALVATLPPDFAVPVVIAQHLDPDHLSHLGEILARRTPLAVHTVVEQEPLQPGGIYVVPADRDVEITDGHVSLRRPSGKRPTPSVNRLFSSAARTHGERLIGVILTGAGTDGAAGARDVKASGGMVIIENPATAAYPSMPQSLASNTVDLIVDIGQIGTLLGEIVTGVYAPAPAEATGVLPQLLAQVREHSGIDFATYKTPTILRRLQRRLAATRTDTLATYLDYLREHPEEYALLVASFLINVTEFFRDADLFTALRTHVLPDLLSHTRQKNPQQIRCWSAGCATGEEAYSLAMLFMDVLGDEVASLPLRIFATDVDAESIAFARRGIYPPNALAKVPPALVARCFVFRDGAYEVTTAVRQMIIFGQHDLAQRAPFPYIDLVLCRNVLIYFTPELQRRALQLFAFALRDGGYLALGKAETTQAWGTAFVPVQAPLKLYRRQGERVLVPPTVLLRPPPPPLVRAIPHQAQVPTSMLLMRTPSLSERVGTLLMQLPIGVVVVDRHYDIQAMNRAAQEFLGIFRPALGEDVLHLLTTIPVAPVRALIDSAFRQQAVSPEMQVTTLLDDQRYLQFTAAAHLAEGAANGSDQVLIQISDVTARVQATETQETQRRQNSTNTPAPPLLLSDQQRAWELERLQLRAENTRLVNHSAHLISINHTLVVANQELAQSNLALTGLNEDVLVRNEELQAAAEEIKSLNEELQATNEELETLNEEQEATVEELRTTNDDLIIRTIEVQTLAAAREQQRQISDAKAAELETIVHSIGDALLVMDAHGAVVVTNDAYLTLFGQTQWEVGAEDEDGHPLPPERLPHHLAATGQPFRMTFTLPYAQGERRYYEAAGEPIHAGTALQGSVVTIRDITDRNLRRLQDTFLALASHELRSPVTTILMSTQLLQRKLPQDASALTPLIVVIHRQTRHLQRLIDDLADVGRLNTGKLHLTMAQVDLCEIARLAQEGAMLAAPIPPIIVDASATVLIRGDAVRLEQIMMNLLTNARRYAAVSPQILLRVARFGDEAEVQVQDHGPGIAHADQLSIFQQFSQITQNVPSTRMGLGLGLFIVHELVVAHGGTIQVHSSLGEGATFTMRFPLFAANA